MDVERTIEFILAQQVKTESILTGLAASQAKTEKQILAMRKLIWAGIKLVADTGQRQAALEEQMKQLAEAQRETDAKFRQLMEVLLKQHKNGS